jgi:hypothetical protein
VQIKQWKNGFDPHNAIAGVASPFKGETRQQPMARTTDQTTTVLPRILRIKVFS